MWRKCCYENMPSKQEPTNFNTVLLPKIKSREKGGKPNYPRELKIPFRAK
jgi:hypothetical protein